MRVLIVGAGAVGQVYGLALRRAGAEVSFFVRPKYAEEARAGFTLYRLPSGAAERFEGFGVLTSSAEVREQTWDQVWLAVSATAIAGPWLEEILEATGDATVVCLQAGGAGNSRVAPLARDRFVLGVIAFIAYQAPLPGETRFTTPGIAFWFPPGGPSPFAGPAARVAPIVDALRRGSCPAKAVASLDTSSTFGAALLQVHVAALDSVGWSWRRARDGDTLALAARAWREAAAVGAHGLGRKTPWWAGLIGPWASRLALWAAPRMIPMDVPTYFGYHFTKVGDQTRAQLDSLLAAGRKAGLPVGALAELRGRLLPEARFDASVTLGER